MSAYWTIQEKQLLFKGLSKYGEGNLQLIKKELPLKTLNDIDAMIKRYKRLATYDPADAYSDVTPIDRWTNILRANTDLNNLAPIPRALKYIALFEERTEDKVKFSDCYEVLSDLSEGIAPKKLSGLTSQMFYHTLNRVANEVKKEKDEEIIEFLETWELEERAERTYGSASRARLKAEDDLYLNPLKVPKMIYKKGSSQDVADKHT